MGKDVAFGTILAVGNGESPSEEFTKVAQVKDLDGPGMSRDTIDVTTHDSPSGYREFLASLRDGGEITFDIEYDPGDASHDQTTGLLSLFGEDKTRNWMLIFPVTAVTGYWGYKFKGLVTGFAPKAPVGGSLTASLTIKVAGAVTQADINISTLC